MNIYFVCTGNTCRSPMAAAILKNKNIPDSEVRSAGIYALEGGEMSENSRAVLLQENIPYDHLSRQVNAADIEWADLILTMTLAHKEMIIRAYPEAKPRTYTLKEYTAPYSSQDVFDPFGGDLNTYKQTYQELKRLIDELETKITEGV
ncbi:low molecular weight protein arginine phosphatase [Solibacillus sp. FSL H8-0538]|uniref:low molecular weight protein arginine phosphatase n=1 Tax=Solibacillus sp. FSL H8-0538 TaxID=2921400 RepID=UPI0030F8D2B4